MALFQSVDLFHQDVCVTHIARGSVPPSTTLSLENNMALFQVKTAKVVWRLQGRSLFIVCRLKFAFLAFGVIILSFSWLDQL